MISALDFEYEFVHAAYEGLAHHIEPVKRWPFVDEFLKDFPAGSLLLDVGKINLQFMSKSFCT